MSWHDQGRVLLVVIDEAQELTAQVLLFVPSLLHTPIGDRLPVRIVLMGTPALASRLRVQAMEPIAQRIVARMQMLGFTLEETRAYLEAGAKALGMAISEEATQIIFQRSRTIPRVLATLARLSATLASEAGDAAIEPRHVALALEEADLR